MYICGSAACYDSLFYCCSCRCQCVFHTKLCFFHFCFCRCSDTNYCHSACKFCKSFLQLLSVKVRCRFLNLSLDLSNPCIDCGFFSHTVYDGSVFFLNLYGLCTSKLIQCRLFQIQSQFLRYHFTTCQDRNVTQHFFSSVTISRCLYRNDIERTTQFVDNECGESFAFYVLCDN